MNMRLAVVSTIGLLALAGCEGNFLLQGGDGTTHFPGASDDDGSGVEVSDDGKVELKDGREVDPGRVTLHRLNRAEYDNTVRDLLGDTTQPAQNFPDDDFGYGFNNIADVLSLSSLHLEMYQKAAATLVDNALASPVTSQTQRFEAETIGSSVGADAGDGSWNLYSNGEIQTVVDFPSDGDYTFRARARQSAGGPDPAQMTIAINGQVVETFDVSNESLQTFEVTTPVDAGGQAVSVAFINDYYDDVSGEDRNLYVDWFEVEGPENVQAPASDARAAIMICDPADSDDMTCGKQIIRTFGKRAWRRPLTDDEVDRLAEFIGLARSQGDGFEQGIRLALQAMLVSPNFIFRVETDPDPQDATPHELDDYELASRLSYFLWSSMPDDELLQLADEGKLQDEDVLRQQVERMLDDPKAQALVDNFATQWLYIDRIEDATPDYQRFPEFDDELRDAMRTEGRMFVKAVFDEDMTAQEMLTADFTFLNERLANFYGISGVTGDDFRRVDLDGTRRRGLLTQGGLLTSLSYPTRTSPVRRGKWVLGNLLCSEPPAPPGNVNTLPQEPVEGTTLREQMEEHSNNPQCAACHKLMDPIGFGFSNYDAVGKWRDMDNGVAVDATGKLPDGTEFAGAYELSGILSKDDKYPHCAAEKMLTYALGRGMESWDDPQIDAIVQAWADTGYGMRELIAEIATSPAFRMRRGGDLPGNG